MTIEDIIAGLAAFVGMLASFGSVFFLGLLWWLRRSDRHNIILESLFLTLGAMFVRQLVVVLIDTGYFGGVDSLGRNIARHSLTALYALVSIWVLVRMLAWLRQDDDSALGEAGQFAS